MCLINFAFQQHETYPFILVGNRDEFYARPTQALHWWNNDGEPILAGKDLQEGGTWMGINKAGQFAALTNYRDLKNINPTAPSRGLLVKNWLGGDLSLADMHQLLKAQGKMYNGFNIIYGDVYQLYYYSNVNETLRQLYPGIYGLSNGLLDTPWPKVENSKAAFRKSLSQKFNSDTIIDILSNATTAPDDQLPATGVPAEWEKKLSAMFITSENYGTRLTTFVLVDANGSVTYREKGFVPEHDITISYSLINGK